MIPMLMLLHDCDHCDGTEERVFTDSYTGLELCGMCLFAILGQVTLSPASEGDNLKRLLKEIS